MNAKPIASFNENDIRPDGLMAGHADRMRADLERLQVHRREFVEVPCPACGSERAQPTFEKYQFNYQTCVDCETVYISPRPTSGHLEEHYRHSENYAYWNRYIFPIAEETRREKIFRPRVERILDACRRQGIIPQGLLEVGAGFGTFCEELKSAGAFARIIAVEPTPDLAESCRKRGLEVIDKPIEQVSLEPGSVNVVASFEVIEHLFSPASFIETCANLLPSGGLLVLTCPNIKGFDITVLQAASDAVDFEHLNYFHPASLAMLVTKFGFEVVEVATPGKLDAELVRKKVISGAVALEDRFLSQVLIHDWERVGASFQAFLADNQLSSHLWLVARKLA